jgi:hypothetical protein
MSGEALTRSAGWWCSVCDLAIFLDDEAVQCHDWPGRYHHDECARDCVECKNALADDRRGI